MIYQAWVKKGYAIGSGCLKTRNLTRGFCRAYGI